MFLTILSIIFNGVITGALSSYVFVSIKNSTSFSFLFSPLFQHANMPSLVIFIFFSISENMIFILFSLCLCPHFCLRLPLSIFLSVSLLFLSVHLLPRLCTLTLLPALISRQCRCQARTYRSDHKLPMHRLCSPHCVSHKPSETLQREREERGGTGSSAGRERESPANC